MRRVSPGTLIALLALFVALGGPAEARKLITGKDVKKGTLTGKHVKNRSLGLGDLTRGAVKKLSATAAGSVGTDAIRDGAVTAPKLAAGSVGSAQVADGSLHGAELASNSVQGDEVDDGRLTARDVGSFVGTLSLDFPSVDPGDCAFIDADVAAVAATTPPRSIGDDAAFVTPPPQFPDDALVLSAAPASPTKLRVRVCNLNGAGAVDLPSMTFRYISFDF